MDSGILSPNIAKFASNSLAVPYHSKILAKSGCNLQNQLNWCHQVDFLYTMFSYPLSWWKKLKLFIIMPTFDHFSASPRSEMGGSLDAMALITEFRKTLHDQKSKKCDCRLAIIYYCLNTFTGDHCFILFVLLKTISVDTLFICFATELVFSNAAYHCVSIDKSYHCYKVI